MNEAIIVDPLDNVATTTTNLEAGSEEVGSRIFNEIVKMASGAKTRSEALGHNEFAIFRGRGHAY